MEKINEVCRDCGRTPHSACDVNQGLRSFGETDLQDSFRCSEMGRSWDYTVFYVHFIALSALMYHRASCDVDSMYNVIKSDVEVMENAIEEFEVFFRYALTGYRCIQVFSDGSPFADYHLDYMHQCLSVPAIVNGLISEGEGCEGFVILTLSLKTFPSTLGKFPLFVEHRFIAIVPSGLDLTNLNVENKLSYGESEILLIASQNLSVALKLGQPDRNRFEIVDNFTEPWKPAETVLNFHGRKIRALTYNCSIFSQIGGLNSDSSANYTDGAEMDIFTDIAKVLNMTIEWKVLEGMPVRAMFFNTDKWYIMPVTEDTTSQSAVDVAFCGLTLSYKKMLSDVDMSLPIKHICFEFLVPRPTVILAQWNSIFRVFRVDVWATIGIALLITGFVLQKVTTLTRKYVRTQGILKYNKLGGSTLQLLSILVLADVPVSKESQGACRFILSFWSFSAMILTTCFSSGLVSHLTSQQYTKKINSIEELVDYKFRWGFLYNPDYSELLNTQGNVLHNRLKKRATHMDSVEALIRRLKQGHYFLWGARIQNWFFLPEEDIPDSLLEHFEVAEYCFIEYFLSFAFRRGSPFPPSFNKFINIYQEVGLLQRTFDRKLFSYSRKRRYAYEVLRVTAPKVSGGPLKLDNLTGIIQVWAVGVAVAVIVFVLEMLQKCYI